MVQSGGPPAPPAVLWDIFGISSTNFTLGPNGGINPTVLSQGWNNTAYSSVQWTGDYQIDFTFNKTGTHQAMFGLNTVDYPIGFTPPPYPLTSGCYLSGNDLWWVFNEGITTSLIQGGLSNGLHTISFRRTGGPTGASVWFDNVEFMAATGAPVTGYVQVWGDFNTNSTPLEITQAVKIV